MKGKRVLHCDGKKQLLTWQSLDPNEGLDVFLPSSCAAISGKMRIKLPNFSCRKITKTKESWFTDSDVESCGVYWQQPKQGAEFPPSESIAQTITLPLYMQKLYLHRARSLQERNASNDTRAWYHVGFSEGYLFASIVLMEKMPFTCTWTHLARSFLVFINI